QYSLVAGPSLAVGPKRHGLDRPPLGLEKLADEPPRVHAPQPGIPIEVSGQDGLATETEGHGPDPVRGLKPKRFPDALARGNTPEPDCHILTPGQNGWAIGWAIGAERHGQDTFFTFFIMH